MRLIGTFAQEKQAYAFTSILSKEGIENSYDIATSPETKLPEYRVWIIQEDDLPAAEEWYTRFKENPDNPAFYQMEEPTFRVERDEEIQQEKADQAWKIRLEAPPKQQNFSLTLTTCILLICAFFFMWDGLQEARLVKDEGEVALQIGITPVQQSLLFDYPAAYACMQEAMTEYPLKSLDDIQTLPPEGQAIYAQANSMPVWKGVYDLLINWKTKGQDHLHAVPMFEKIREGEVWRLFTPCILHRDFLHILFNMAWVWILGKQIEARIGKLRMLLMILVIGIIANIAQYLMSGAFFLGFSGVVVGMAGFIWVRQRTAPWEGYPLERSTLLFLVLFLVAMFALDLVAFFLEIFQVTKLIPNIANTAHIVGGLVGMLLGKISLFSRKVSP